MSLQPRPGGKQAVPGRGEAEGWEEDSSRWGERKRGGEVGSRVGDPGRRAAGAESQPLLMLGPPAFSQGAGRGGCGSRGRQGLMLPEPRAGRGPWAGGGRDARMDETARDWHRPESEPQGWERLGL